RESREKETRRGERAPLHPRPPSRSPGTARRRPPQQPMKALVPLLAALATAAIAAEKPNIVLILADDMGFSDLGCYGGEIATPNLDALAAGGVKFSRFYNSARCCPTRASLLTGLHPHQAGIGHMTVEPEGKPDDRRPPAYRGLLSSDVPTIAETLRDAGYATLM